MRRHSSATLTDYPESPEAPSSWLDFIKKSRDQDQLDKRHSHMGNIIASIRHGLSHEHERIPEKSGALSHRAEQQPVTSHPNADRTGGSSPRDQATWNDEESISPAIEARRMSENNENNMGEGSHQAPTTWGWPGLGSWPERGRPREKVGKMSAKERTLSLEPRLEAATFEAIDNAADSEAFGWPGLGYWPGTGK